MDLIQIIILAVIQGITEFLPVSSSAHLILLSKFSEFSDQGLVMDVAAHFGSLLAVILYFHRDLRQIIAAGIGSCIKKRVDTHEAKLFWLICFASIPVLAVGYVFRDYISTELRDPLVIAGATIIFGLLLWLADVVNSGNRRMYSISFIDAMIIGAFQVLALIPGTSRSGITITAALLLGFGPKEASRFAFLLAIPVILAATGYESLKLYQSGLSADLVTFSIVTGLSAFCAFITIHLFIRLIEKTGMLPYVIYRLILGLVLIYLFVEW